MGGDMRIFIMCVIMSFTTGCVFNYIAIDNSDDMELTISTDDKDNPTTSATGIPLP
jgi:hypothetical protein